MSSDAPPPYVPTIYDETLRSIQYPQLSIMSMANRPNFIGQLDYHSPTTDGSFSGCVAGGEGVFISKALLDSIPSEHRPVLDTRNAGRTVQTLSGPLISLGTTFFPFILTNHTTGQKFRVVLYAIVLPDLFMAMFIGGFDETGVARNQAWPGDGSGPIHGFAFGGANGITLVKGI